MKTNRTRQISLAGILTSLSVVSLYLSFVISTITLTFMAFNILILMYLVHHKSYYSAVLCFLATSILGVVLVNISATLPYIVFYGGYFLASSVMEKCSKIPTIVKEILRAIYILIAMYIFFGILKLVINPSLVDFISKTSGLVILIIIATIIILLLDRYVIRKYVPIMINEIDKRLKIHKPTNTVEQNNIKMSKSSETDLNANENSLYNIDKVDTLKDIDVFEFYKNDEQKQSDKDENIEQKEESQEIEEDNK